MFRLFGKKNKEENSTKPAAPAEYIPDHKFNYGEVTAQMDEIDLSDIDTENALSENSSEPSELELDMKRNPEKYMEQEIREIEEDEKALIEAEEKRNGKPLDIQTWELLEKERAERKARRIEACREKWLGVGESHE